ncbi:hypothetical protein [Paenibacillus alkalitolerans]|uniref:hypothetical protein n=1 Tax=Paenibacillus alkalitolerans TaxID=2799335 RepID=UPI0018F5BD62|nr:hypothetical protein [Paenibacillus alkalitolerans]
MEKTIYEIKYNDWFTVRMTSDREPMEEIEFDKAALEAVFADIVLRVKDRQGSVEESIPIWRWVCSQLGLALQNTGLVPDSELDPLDSVIIFAARFKGGTK